MTEMRSAADAANFKRELTGVIPHLRAFARGLCGRPDLADDLVQELCEGIGERFLDDRIVKPPQAGGPVRRWLSASP